MDLGIKGKRALVMGGGKGIGRGIAEALAKEGVDVAVVSRNAATLQEAAASFAKHGVRTLAAAADLHDRATIESAFTQVVKAFGGIDILVNNSGGPPPTDVIGVPDDLWHKQFEAMVLSLIRLTELALPGMRERRWGRIMTVASSGVIQPIQTLVMSNTLRSALAGWHKTLATEVARDGITANMLLPGSIRTERIAQVQKVMAEKAGRTLQEVETEFMNRLPIGRLGTPEEFGAVAAFIASVPAAYITGSMIRIDGGAISSI
jgi:3-oxoacyl-[acyl-carrier protein] reductase